MRRSAWCRRGRLSLATTNDQSVLDPDIGDEYELLWVDIADPDASPVVVTGQPSDATLGFMAGPTLQALSRGCMRMSPGEGIWYFGTPQTACSSLTPLQAWTRAAGQAVAKAQWGTGPEPILFV